MSSKRVTAGLLLLLLLAVHGLYQSHLTSTRLTFQARANLEFAHSDEGFAETLSASPGIVPPLYASLLYGGHRLGLPPAWANEGLLILALGLLFLFARRELRVVPPLVVVALYASTEATYAFGKLLTSETLFVALALAVLLTLRRTLETDRVGWLLTLTGLCAAIFLTRYVGVFWLGPLVGLHLLLRDGPIVRRIARTAAFAIGSLTPLLAWLSRTYAKTGELTGMDRFGDRHYPRGHEDWAEMTGLGDNLFLTAKTYAIDLFSPSRTAYHRVLEAPWAPGPLEVIGLLLAAAVIGMLVRWVWHERPGGASLSGTLVTLYRESPTFLVAEFLGAYAIVLVGIWTVGNNDPIYTRFLLPSYVFVLLLLTMLLDRARLRHAGAPLRACFVGLLVVIGLAQASKVLGPMRRAGSSELVLVPPQVDRVRSEACRRV